MSRPSFLNGLDQPTLAERVQLIRSPSARTVAKATLTTATLFYTVIVRTSSVALSGLSLLYRCTQLLFSLPSIARNILFPDVALLKKTSELIESDLFVWLRRVLKKPLDSANQEQIHKAIEGRLSEGEERDLIATILLDAKEGVFDLPETGVHQFTKVLGLAKKAAEKERLAPLAPLEQVKKRQAADLETVGTLAKSLTLIDPNQVQTCVNNPNEARYLNSRAEFIRTQCPNLDPDNLWRGCSNETLTADAATAIGGRLTAFQNHIEDHLAQTRVTPSEKLLRMEYCILLRQRLSLSCAIAIWRRSNGQVNDLNTTVRQGVVQFHATLLERFRDANATIGDAALGTLDPAGDIALYFQQVRAVLLELHKRELAFFEKNPKKLAGYFPQTGAYRLQEAEKIIAPTIDTVPRNEILSIRDSKHRINERQRSLSKLLLTTSLEGTPDGQHLLRLLKLDPSLSLSKEDRLLRDAARQYLDQLYEKRARVLHDAVYSTPEYVAEIGGAGFASLQDIQGQAAGYDLASLERKLQIQEADWRDWHTALQKIWIETLSHVNEEEIRNANFGKARTKKMAELFAAWMLNKTSIPFARVLSFSDVRLPSTARDRAKALETIAKHIKSGQARIPRPVNPDLTLQKTPEHPGFPIDWIALDPPVQPENLLLTRPPVPYDAGNDLMDGQTDLVSRLKALPPYDPNADLQARADWIVDACQNELYTKGLTTGSLILHAAFRDIALAYATQNEPVPQPLLDAFIDLILNDDQNSLCKDNTWRKDVLHRYLTMVFAGQAIPIEATDKQRKHLVQLATLAEFELPNITVTETGRSLDSKKVDVLGQALQETEIGLEGLEESVIQLSFQGSPLPTTPETRTRIDALRARQGASLPVDLFKYVSDAYDVTHHEGYQAIIRALSAFRHHNLDGLEEAFQAQLNPAGLVEIDPNTMALPEKIVFLDALGDINADFRRNHADEIAEFNRGLINSGNVAQMLMGYAREIDRLSREFPDNDTIEAFAGLLKLKIAYQALKASHFDGKATLSGFLKYAVDRAEFSMASTLHILESTATTFDASEVVEALLQTQNPDPAQRTHAEKAIEKVFKTQQETSLPVDFTEPFFITFGRTDIDVITGSVYYDGQQRLELPALFQNNPHVRSLGIQNLPYVRNPDGSFSHYTFDDGEPVSQIRLAIDAEGSLIIQRRLPTGFAPSSDIEKLQFVPLESFDQIPTALAFRMGIKEFWTAEDGGLYGYSEKGSLICSIGNNNIIATESGPLRFPNGEETERSPAGFVLQHLLKSLPKDEILIEASEDTDFPHFRIPMLDLTISFDRDGAWHCASPQISGMVLDFDSPPIPSVLTLKREGRPKSRKHLEDRLIVLRSRLREAEAIGHPSLIVKAEIDELKARIHKTELDLAQIDPRLYILPLLEPIQDMTSLVQSLKYHAQALERLSAQIAQETDPEESRELQGRYLEAEKLYRDSQAEHRQASSTTGKAVTFETLREGHVAPRDLPGTLFLVILALIQNKDLDPRVWIKEIAKHPFSQALPKETLKLVELAANYAGTRGDELHLYLNLLLCENNFSRLQLAAATLTHDREARVQEAKDNYEEQKDVCTRLATALIASGKELPLDIRALLYTHCPGTLQSERPVIQEAKPVPPVAAQELKAASVQSLVERLSLEGGIVATQRNVATDITGPQRALVRDFNRTLKSQDQVVGVYGEEFGLFNVVALYAEFNIDEDDAASRGLFGLTRDSIDTVFKSLISRQWIAEGTPGTDFYCSVTAKGASPLVLFQKEELLALVAHLPMTASEREIVADRLRAFLFRLAQASFSYSWKDSSALGASHTRLAEERDYHQERMADAHFFLRKRLAAAGLSLTEFQKRVLMNDRRPLRFDEKAPADESLDDKEARELTNFDAARNALIRYLIHKTELQHIDNAMKAPLKGERNQIELLSTARQYSTDDIFVPGNDESRIMQLAFLLLEESLGVRMNASQVKLFRALMLESENEEAWDAIQARMGFGKTALLPIMAIVQLAKEALLAPEEKSLIRYVVPKAVLQDNASAFHARLSGVLGSIILKDREFSRYQIDPEKKEESLKWALADLRSRLEFYKHVRDEGLVLIQTPEIRQSMEAQELAFGFLITKGTLTDRERALCMECKQMLGRIRSLKTYTIFDELDATQDHRATDVNFTEGAKLQIGQEEIRPLVTLIACVNEHHAEPHRELAVSMLRSVGIDPSDDLVNYLTDRRERLEGDLETFVRDLQDSDQEKYASIFLIRAILLDPNIFAFVYNRQPSTHFGVRFTEKDGKRVYSIDPVSGSPLLIAVPYEGTNVPKGLSTFDNTEVAAIATLRYYASPETPFDVTPHVDFLVKQTQQQKIPAFLNETVRDIRNGEGLSFTDALTKLSGLLDRAEIAQAKAQFYKDFLENPTQEVRTYFGMAVVATQVSTDEARANSTRYEMGSPKDRIKGCSGTVGSTSGYFKKPANDPAADGLLSLEIMGRDENAPIARLAPFSERGDYLDYILPELLTNANQDTRAIVDAAGIVKSRDGTPETIVQKLWELLQRDPRFRGIEGIVYYGKDNIKRLYRGPSQPPIPCTTAMELAALAGKKYFSFYGQKNTRGSDIKQADGAHALVTMDENVPNSDAKQAVLRFRNLVKRSSGQWFTFALTDRFAQMLGPDIDAKAVIKHLRRKERAQEMQDAQLLFTKELKAHVQQAAGYIEHQIFSDVRFDVRTAGFYQEFLTQRDRIIPMVERAMQELDAKYGGSLRTITREEFIAEQVRICDEKLSALEQLAIDTRRKISRRAATGVNINFFKGRRDQSVKLFKSRYPEDKDVEISSGDTAAEAVAMALAQAEAQAQAEAVAENLATSEVVAQPSLPDLRVPMTEIPHFTTPDVWFADPVGAPIEDFDEIKYLVHPTLRRQIQLSPHLRNQRIVSHFALIPFDPDTNPEQAYIFISQEEAEAWINTPQGQRSADYLYTDLRQDPELRDVFIINNMKEAILRNIDEIPPINATQALRDLTLTNVTTDQLLPHLTVTGATAAELEPLIDLTSFGVTRENPVPIRLEKAGDQFTIATGIATVSIPTGNEWLRPLFARFYADPAPGKFRRIQTQFAQDSAAFRAELDVLQREQAELARKRADLNALVQNASAFTTTPELEDGLKTRDGEFATKTQPDSIKNCGRDFINDMARIKAAQEALSRDPSRANLSALDGLFRDFLSDKMSQFTGSFDTTEVYAEPGRTGQAFWTQNRERLPSFDRVYGRILYDVHAGDIADAKRCTRQDCSQMFNVTLPNMQLTLQRMREAIQKLPDIEREIHDIEARIAAFEARARTLEEADKCIVEMESQRVSTTCAGAGVVLVGERDDRALFWDRVHLGNIHGLDDQVVQATLQGVYPSYSQTHPKMMGFYEDKIHALTPDETRYRQAHLTLARTTIRLGQQIEPRPNEVVFL